MSWQPLGDITPEFEFWQMFSGEVGVAQVFRIRYQSSGNIEKVFSTLWLRRVWTSGFFQDKEVELSQKLYPQINSVILYLPLPPLYNSAGLILEPVGYEVKKSYYRKGAAEPLWFVSLDFWDNAD
jgi:hypothetical protein